MGSISKGKLLAIAPVLGAVEAEQRHHPAADAVYEAGALGEDLRGRVQLQYRSRLLETEVIIPLQHFRCSLVLC